MNKEEYNRIDNKLDHQTVMLMEIKDDLNREVSLLKLAHQKLRFFTYVLGVLFMLKVAIDYPNLAKFIKKLL